MQPLFASMPQLLTCVALSFDNQFHAGGPYRYLRLGQ